MIIILMGYMGSGKSTIGSKLASKLSYRFLDLDDYIVTSEGLDIETLFTTKGELFFRKKETFYLNKILSESENLVLALGGGTPCYGDNLKILLNHKNIKLLYLKLSLSLLSERLFYNKEKRPLIKHIASQELLTEFIAKHLFERSAFYNQAHIIINTDNKTEEDVVNLIENVLI